MTKITAAITAVGAYVPDFVLSNKVLETMVDTNDEWITTRTGIKERRILKEEGAGSSFMAVRAAQNLIEKSGIDPKDSEVGGGASAVWGSSGECSRQSTAAADQIGGLR